jgi:hypothetical protein
LSPEERTFEVFLDSGVIESLTELVATLVFFADGLEDTEDLTFLFTLELDTLGVAIRGLGVLGVLVVFFIALADGFFLPLLIDFGDLEGLLEVTFSWSSDFGCRVAFSGTF